jgi:alkanesulfonate monooxygenase
LPSWCAASPDQYRARPTIYLGGESELARALAADHADVWFINGQPLGDVNQLIADVSSRPRHGAPLRFGLSAFVIARDSHEEAMRHAGVFSISLQKMRRCAPIQKLNTDPEVVMKQTMAKSPRVGTNGGTAVGLVGSYDTVTRRIGEFHAAGIELFMLQFQPFEAEMARFAENIIPRFRDHDS